MGRIRVRRAGLGLTGSSAVLLSLAGCAGGSSRQPTPANVAADVSVSIHRVYVANESSDLVTRLAFVPGGGLSIEKEIPVGLMPADNDGAHGIAVSPNGRFWYLTLAHGTPSGQLWKFHAGPDTLVARTSLGLFPATMGVSRDGTLLLAANFNLHGDMVPSNVSVVHTPTMLELTRIETCLMPHGGRVDRSGVKHYSACMHSDQLVEIDVTRLEVSGRFLLEPGAERVLSSSDGGTRSSTTTVCSPTWVEPAETGSPLVYVACNRNREVLEIDTEAWRVVRRFPTGSGPYNLEATADGRLLLATLKGEQAVAVFDLAAGTELARVRTSRPVTHGVVASPDARFAFVSNESIGSAPGTVDVVDLETLDVVGSIEVGQQAGGIDYWGGVGGT